jgi:hypothetical protein
MFSPFFSWLVAPPDIDRNPECMSRTIRHRIVHGLERAISLPYRIGFLKVKQLRQAARAAGSSPLFPAQVLECYIVTMANPLSSHPLSPAAGVGSRLVLAGAVLTMVWLAVLWALS